MQNWNPLQIWGVNREIWNFKIKSNKELYIPMQIALNSWKVQNGIHKIGHVLLTDGQNEMRFSFLCFLFEREHFWPKKKKKKKNNKKTKKQNKQTKNVTDFWNSIKTSFSFNSQHYRNEMHFP